jgi:hypothetical protein
MFISDVTYKANIKSGIIIIIIVFEPVVYRGVKGFDTPPPKFRNFEKA